MKMYIIRHADAGDPNAFAGPDEERPLSPLGVRQAKALAAALASRGIDLGVLLTSPLKRAKQTATRLGSPEECDLLMPGFKKGRLARHVRKLKAEAVAVVGHEPDLSAFAAWLIGSQKAKLTVAKGAIVQIDCPDGPAKGGGALVWQVGPEWYMPS